MAKAIIRCAIYTRKSSEEGLDQDFNSLEAQREACEAYIKSQAHEGWRLEPGHYDDGGVSGGTMDRPALKTLMVAIEARQVDRIVVYKIDRLTRSLADFAKLVDALDAVGASFVSVTQSFNTSTSMGRLTLNVLLSFAQFEREVTAERIRDKLAASKAKGMWMGGRVPTGYDAKDRTLTINMQEAKTIRRLFALYLELGRVPLVEQHAKAESLISKRYRTNSGKMVGGRPFSRGLIYRILNNPIYVGRIAHKEHSYPGLHKAIIDQETWDQVQARLASGPRTKGGQNARGILSGRLLDSDGVAMTRHCARTRGKTYSYYLSGKASQHQWRIKAGDIEACASWATKQIITQIQPAQVIGITSQAQVDAFDASKQARLNQSVRCTLKLIETVRLGVADITVTVDKREAEAALDVAIQNSDVLSARFEAELTKRGHELKLVYDAQQANPDPTLQTALLKALQWKARIMDGESIADIARSDGLSAQVTARRLRLALLSPRIQLAIAKGHQPAFLTLERIIKTKLPIAWLEQEKLLLEQGNEIP